MKGNEFKCKAVTTKQKHYSWMAEYKQQEPLHDINHCNVF